MATLKHWVPASSVASLPGSTLLSPAAWDSLRMHGEETPYSIPATRDLWLRKAAANEEVQPRARGIVDIARRLDYKGITSCGVGGAWLEFHLKRLAPDLRLTISDFASEGLERLRKNFVECDEVRSFDLRSPEWPADGNLLLLHRVDMELSDAEWQRAFASLGSTGVAHVLFIACGTLTWREALQQLWTAAKARLGRMPVAWCGWLRSRSAFPGLWNAAYAVESEVSLGGLDSYLLRRRGESER